MPVSAAITFRMTMGSGYVAVIRGMPVTPQAGVRTDQEENLPPTRLSNGRLTRLRQPCSCRGRYFAVW